VSRSSGALQLPPIICAFLPILFLISFLCCNFFYVISERTGDRRFTLLELRVTFGFEQTDGWVYSDFFPIFFGIGTSFPMSKTEFGLSKLTSVREVAKLGQPGAGVLVRLTPVAPWPRSECPGYE